MIDFYFLSQSHSIKWFLFSSECRPSRKVNGCRRNRSAERNYVNSSKGSRTMTPAACLASPASLTTTITGRLPPFGQVRDDLVVESELKNIVLELFIFSRADLMKKVFVEPRCNIRCFPLSPLPLSPSPSSSLPQWVHSVHAPVPTTTPTGASGPSMTHTTSCSVNLLPVSWSILTSTLTHTRYVICTDTHIMAAT